MVDYYAVASAVLVSLGTVLLGYLKTTKPEDFSYEKLIATLLIGLCVGVGTAAFGLSAAQVETWLLQAGLTVWIYWLAKLVAVKLGV